MIWYSALPALLSPLGPCSPSCTWIWWSSRPPPCRDTWGREWGEIKIWGGERERLGWEGQTYICLLTSNSKLPSCLEISGVINGDQWHEMRGLTKRKEMRGVEPHAWFARGECSRRMFSTLLYSTLLRGMGIDDSMYGLHAVLMCLVR
jgi:hypothetical protein